MSNDTNLAIEAKGLNKSYVHKYGKKVKALIDFDIKIPKGVTYGLLGPNGAGKSTFINILGGLVIKNSGDVKVCGINLDKNLKKCRKLIGIVPQELNMDPFFTPLELLELQAGLYGVKKKERKTLEILKSVGLTEQKDSYARNLSGGMKRRLLVAKALVHDPEVVILDEPTAGVDVELRQEMWKVVQSLRETGVTIILTTHYIEEAEAIADRVGVINQGEIIVVEKKKELLKKMGRKKLIVELQDELDQIPESLKKYNLIIGNNKMSLDYTYDLKEKQTGITNLLQDIKDTGLKLRDLKTEQSNLEKIFVTLVRENNEN